MNAVGSPPSELIGTVLDGLAVVLLDDAGETRYVSPDAIGLAGVDPADRPVDVDALVQPADRDALAAAVVDVLDGDTSAARIVVRTRSERPGHRLAAVRASRVDADPGGVLVRFDDVTRVERLRRVHYAWLDPDDGIVAASDRDEIVDRVRGASGKLDGVELGVYHRDATTTSLCAATGSTGTPAEPVVREVARTGRPRRLDGRAFPLAAFADGDFTAGVAVPIGDHGVLVAGLSNAASLDPDQSDPSRLDPDQSDPSSLDLGLIPELNAVAATVALSYDRVADRRDRQQLRSDLDVSRAAFERFRDVVQAIDRTERDVFTADSTRAVQRAACDGVASMDAVAFAWFGAVPTGETTLVDRATAGNGGEYLDRVAFEVDDRDAPPAVRAVREREPVFERDVAAGYRSTAWRRRALDAGFRSALAIPIGDDATFGVLTVYGRAVDSLADPLRRGLLHLARTVEFVLNAVELRAVALGNTSVELELSIPAAADPLVALATALNDEVRFEGATVRQDAPTRVYVSTDAPSASVLDAAGDVDGIADAVHLRDRGRRALFELAVSASSVPGALADLGSTVLTATARKGEIRARIAVSRSVDVRALVEAVRESYPGTTLLARRTRDVPVEADRRFRQEFEERLTDRQRESLQAAHFAGYFESPRLRTGSEIAADLGITQPTFASHLRTAQNKLLTLLFEAE